MRENQHHCVDLGDTAGLFVGLKLLETDQRIPRLHYATHQTQLVPRC